MVKWIYPFSSKKIKFLFLIQRGRDAPACLVMWERGLPKTKTARMRFHMRAVLCNLTVKD